MRLESLKALYACFAQAAQHEHANAKDVFALLVMVAFVTTLILHLRVDQNEHTEQVQGNLSMPKPGEFGAIDIHNQVVPLPAPPSMNNHCPSNNSHRTASPTSAIEGEQTSYGVSSQHTTVRAPLPIPGSDAVTLPQVRGPEAEAVTLPQVLGPEAEEPNLKFESKIAIWVTTISAGGIASVLSGVIGNKKAPLPRKLLLRGFTSLSYIALVFGTGLLILIKINPAIPGFVRIVNSIMWIAVGSLVYSLGMATCIMFPANVEVVLILVVPLVMVGLVGILNFARRE